MRADLRVVSSLPNGTVIVTQNEFSELMNYSTTLPSGTTEGKQWRRACDPAKQGIDDDWMLGTFGKPYPEGHQYHGSIPIHWNPIIIEGRPLRYRIWLK